MKSFQINSAYELKFILEETSDDLGRTGKDNTFGWGKLNAKAALNYSIDNMTQDLTVDGASIWAENILWDCSPDIPLRNSEMTIHARVSNIGGKVPSNIETKFYYHVGQQGTADFDPNGDGDPQDGNFAEIDKYMIPILGPRRSRHESEIASVKWMSPNWSQDEVLSIGVAEPKVSPLLGRDKDPSNNAASRPF